METWLLLAPFEVTMTGLLLSISRSERRRHRRTTCIFDSVSSLCRTGAVIVGFCNLDVDGTGNDECSGGDEILAIAERDLGGCIGPGLLLFERDEGGRRVVIVGNGERDREMTGKRLTKVRLHNADQTNADNTDSADAPST